VTKSLNVLGDVLGDFLGDVLDCRVSSDFFQRLAKGGRNTPEGLCFEGKSQAFDGQHHCPKK
jgi:hypothetical protein